MSDDRLEPTDDARVIVEELCDIGRGLDLLSETLAANQLEQTAATILAAFLTNLAPDRPRAVVEAVALAYALREELDKGKP